MQQARRDVGAGLVDDAYRVSLAFASSGVGHVRGRVYPLHSPQGSAIAVYTHAHDLLPCDFLRGTA